MILGAISTKKIFALFFIISVIFACGCTRESKEASETYNPADYKRTYNIIEETYLEMITDIINNPSVYIGSNLNIEGMFKTEDEHKYVYRNGPECCYPEGIICGFEFENDNISLNENDWILVSGTLSYYETNDGYHLILKDCEVSKPEIRGLETVQHDTHEETDEIDITE